MAEHTPEQTPDEETKADLFLDGLVLRGEAAEAVDGKLPDGVTHEIIVDVHGRGAVHRRRFYSA